MDNLPLVHARIEATFRQESQKSSRQRSIDIIRGALGDEIAELVMANAVPDYSDIEDALNELGEQLHRQKMPMEVVEQVYNGKLKQDVMTLDKALDEYAAYKAGSLGSEKEVAMRVERIKRDMAAVYGKPKLTSVSLQDITRQDANDLRDHLLKRLSPNSALRTLGVVRTAINHVIVEHGLHIQNVFNKLKVKGAGASKLDRLPISDDQLKAVLVVTADSPLANALLTVLADSGARLGEIVGLEAQDIDFSEGSMHIRPNSIRGLKTTSSTRSIPLSERSRGVLSAYLSNRSNITPIFEKYARPRGSDAASAMLMKHLRKVVDDPKVTIHSLRHRMKDRLRNTGCPEVLSMAILGHSTNTIAANYGSGYALDIMRKHMELAWGEVT